MSVARESAVASSQVAPPPWESPEWQEAVRHNPGLKPFFDNLESFVELPEGVEKLRNVFLRLAVQGRLLPQVPSDEPADELMDRALNKRKEIIKTYRLRSTNEFEAVSNEERPYELPNGWRWCRFGEFGAFMGGGTPSKGNSAYWSGNIPWVTPKDMKRPLIEDAIDHVSQEGIDNSSAKLIPTESLLMVVRGMILIHSFPIAISKRELTINQDMKAMVLGDKQLADYLLLLGQASRDRMLEIVQRSTHGTCRLATEDLEAFVVGLPPLAEQRRIVSKVSGLMSLCDTLESHRRARESVRERASRSVLASLTSAPRTASTGERPKAAPKRQASGVETLASAWQRLSDHFEVLLDQPSGPAHLRQSILQLAVQGKLVPQDPSDEPASEMVSKIASQRSVLLKDGKINKAKKLPDIEDDEKPFDEIPESWAWVRVTDVFDVSGGITKNPKRKPVENHFPYLRVANVQRGRLELDEIARFELFDDDLERWRLEPNDLLVVEGNGSEKEIGRCATWSGEIEDCVHQNHIIRCRPIAHEGHTFTLKFLNSPSGMNAMKKLAITTSGLYSLSVGKIRSLVIPLPPKAEQKRIVSKVSVLLSQLDELSARLRSRQSTTDALLTALIHQILEGAQR